MVAARQAVTHDWWEALDKSRVWVSELVALEVARGDAQAAQRRLSLIAGLPMVTMHPDAFDLAQKLMQAKIVPLTEPEDAMHIALATLHGFKFLATWNFAHFVGPEPKMLVMNTLLNRGYTPALFITPEEYMEGEY